ncbi:tsp-7, partial [Pristionchus pacificus]
EFNGLERRHSDFMLRENVFRLCRERKDICIRMYLKDRGLPYPYYCSYYIYSGWIVSNAALVGGVSTVMSSLQIVGVCFACCLSKSILKDFHDFYY